MTDFVFKRMTTGEKNDSGIYELFGFAVEDYIGELNHKGMTIPDSVNVAGVVLESNDTKSSIQNLVAMIGVSNIDIFVFGFIDDADENYDRDVCKWIDDAFNSSGSYTELPNVYEHRIVFTKHVID